MIHVLSEHIIETWSKQYMLLPRVVADHAASTLLLLQRDE